MATISKTVYALAHGLRGFGARETLRVRVIEWRDGHAWVVTSDLADSGTALTVYQSQVELIDESFGLVAPDARVTARIGRDVVDRAGVKWTVVGIAIDDEGTIDLRVELSDPIEDMVIGWSRLLGRAYVQMFRRAR